MVWPTLGSRTAKAKEQNRTEHCYTCLFDDEALHDVHDKADEFGVHRQRLDHSPHQQRRQRGGVHQLLHHHSQDLLGVDGPLGKAQVTRYTHTHTDGHTQHILAHRPPGPPGCRWSARQSTGYTLHTHTHTDGHTQHIRCAQPHGLELLAGRPPRTAGLLSPLDRV